MPPLPSPPSTPLPSPPPPASPLRLSLTHTPPSELLRLLVSLLEISGKPHTQQGAPLQQLLEQSEVHGGGGGVDDGAAYRPRRASPGLPAGDSEIRLRPASPRPFLAALVGALETMPAWAAFIACIAWGKEEGGGEPHLLSSSPP
ncbi:MAG: hypothetical protein VXZ78_07015, partial [Pseudomonadota bacterium]|nr:hypothetical protein [Pseudomonadota bacterium]